MGISISIPLSFVVLFHFLQVLLKENGNLNKDSNVTMEIPIHTTIAYGLIELEVKQDGRYSETSFIKITH